MLSCAAVAWQHRPRASADPIVYFDNISLNVRQYSRILDKSVFLTLGINIKGQKALSGMWIAENEGAEFWLSVLTEQKHHGLNDAFIAGIGGLIQRIRRSISHYVSCIGCTTACVLPPGKSTRPSPVT